MRTLSKIALILALLSGPFACAHVTEARAVTAAVGVMVAADLAKCEDRSATWAEYDACEAAISACARHPAGVAEYQTCAAGVVGR
jgi:hypothetical protein